MKTKLYIKLSNDQLVKVHNDFVDKINNNNSIVHVGTHAKIKRAGNEFSYLNGKLKFNRGRVIYNILDMKKTLASLKGIENTFNMLKNTK